MSVTSGSCIRPVFPFIHVKMAIFVACMRDTKHLSTVSALVSLGTDSDPCLRAFCPSDPYLSTLCDTQLLRHGVCQGLIKSILRKSLNPAPFSSRPIKRHARSLQRILAQEDVLRIAAKLIYNDWNSLNSFHWQHNGRNQGRQALL